MHYRSIPIAFLFSSALAFSQTAELQTQVTKPAELEELKEKVKELEEIQNETSEIVKRTLADQHYDQNSRGYLEIKIGRSTFNPEDIEDENEELFNNLDSANWESFEHANLLELEIGKTILSDLGFRHEIGIGYQHLSSELDASFQPSDSGGRVKIYETVSIHTLFARYAMLFKANPKGNLWAGPGFGFGYSPISKIAIDIERGDEGVKIEGEGTSYLLELYGKGKLEISRYFSIIATAGYRIQEADDLRLNAADLISVQTKTNLDASGLFATVGLGISF